MARYVRLALIGALVVLSAGIVAVTAGAMSFIQGDPCAQPDLIFVCPQGTVEAPYSIQLKGGGGCAPLSFTNPVGALPPGLSLSSSGLLSGTPTTAGESRFWLYLYSACPADDPAQREFSITIIPRVLVTTESAPSGTLGVPYSLGLTAAMKSGPNSTAPASSALTWTVVAGTLPSGVTLDANSGALSGTPTAEGAFLFTAKAALVDGRSDTKSLEIVVRKPLAIAATSPMATAPLPTLWEVGVPFSSKLTPSGGSGTYTFALAAGSLPTGMTLAADGSVVGTPRTAGVYRATLRLSDTEGRTADYAANFGVAARLAVSTLALRAGKVGRLYRARIASAGGVLPRKWKIAKGPLPKGIRFDPKLGILSGTPTQAGRYRVTFQVTDGLKVVAKKTLRIDILDA
jgi:Putative Ig domain